HYMNNITILWVDDEIDLLKPHILFLQGKGYEVVTSRSGQDALEELREQFFDIVFLDENMPGISGLETLSEIKKYDVSIPVVMVTKSEEEYIMDEAIGSKIADYLIKPVNPNQLLLSLKKSLDNSRLISEKTTANYQQEFRKIAMDLSMVNTYQEMMELYKKLIYWELQLEQIEDSGMFEILESQKVEANSQFDEFVERNYREWFKGGDAPVMSHTLFRKGIQPELQVGKTLLVVIDNLRYDQWLAFEKNLRSEEHTSELQSRENLVCRLLLEKKKMARAIFAGPCP